MASDPGRLTHDEAMRRVHDAGVGAGKFGSPADRNPYKGKASMTEEFAQWEAGRQVGASECKVGGIR